MIDVTIDSIQAVRTLARKVALEAAVKKKVIDVEAAGEVAVTPPDGVAGSFTATYTPQATSELPALSLLGRLPAQRE